MSDYPQFIGAYQIDKKVCDALIEYFNHPDVPKSEGVSTLGAVNKLVKDSIDATLVDPTKKLYLDALQECVELYIQTYRYSAHEGPDWGISENVNIQYYPPGAGFHAWHCERRDMEPSIRRHLVFLTYLNDVYKGGETEFFYQKFRVQPRKGLTLIWPTDWTFMHRGIPSFEEEKYVVTGWFSYKRK